MSGPAHHAPLVPLEYRGAGEAEGPLLVVDGVEDVGFDESRTVRLASGEVRRGLVLEVHRDLAVIQVLQGTAGIDPNTVTVAFEGRPLEIPVGEGWLGRVWNGMGEAIDGGPPMIGATTRPVAGSPINPTARDVPHDPILTGISVIDALTTLVRGQKLPMFSSAGLPHLELAAQIAAQANVAGEPFKVVVVAMGLTHADAATMRDALETRTEAGDLALFLDLADDPVVQRVVAPRVALTVAEYLAFDRGHHVLVLLADMTSYCEAVREVSAARGEIPGRRAYPGYLYSDLASLYERCGRLRGCAGSVTQVPVLTMPAGDITHPVPDLTGYITEGQIVLSPEVHGQGIYPPVDVLGSLSRLMRKGAGEGRTRADHPAIAAQLVAALSRSRDVRDLAELIGVAALSETDQRYLAFADAFTSVLVDQHADESRLSTTPLPVPGVWHPSCLDANSRWSRSPTSPPTTHRARWTATPPQDVPAAEGTTRRQRPWPTMDHGTVVAEPVPPGRAGRLWLRRRLASTRRSVALLDRKRQLLLHELGQLAAARNETRQRWVSSCTEAERWGMRATALGGVDDVRVPPLRLRPRRGRRTMAQYHGVWHPDEPRCSLPVLSPAGGAAANAAVAPAAASYRKALEAAVARGDGRLVALAQRRATGHRATPAGDRTPPSAWARRHTASPGPASRRTRTRRKGSNTVGWEHRREQTFGPAGRQSIDDRRAVRTMRWRFRHFSQSDGMVLPPISHTGSLGGDAQRLRTLQRGHRPLQLPYGGTDAGGS